MTQNNDICPLCDAGLQGEEIPEEYRGYYPSGTTHYSRIQGVEVQGVYDGILFWQCPECRGRWQRWPEGHRLHKIAARYIPKEVDS